MIISLFSLLLILLTIFSYFFVDGNLSPLSFLYTGFATNKRFVATTVYILFVTILMGFYLFFIKRKNRMSTSSLKKLIVTATILLFPAYPAMLSYDIFNYMMTSKVLFFYGENPYLTMPIEFIGDQNLAFTRAANKIALYGPSWILLTGIPYVMGFQNILVTVFSFKLFIAVFYLATAYLIWKISKKAFPVLLFAVNPLVLIETLISAHNDIVMMFFALLAFYFLQKKHIVLAIIIFVIAVLIKYATLFLFPLFLVAALATMRKKKVDWNNTFHLAGWSMVVVLLLSPLREELYPWYVMWVLPFAVLVPERKVLISVTLTLSFVALLRYVPVLATGSYFGLTPVVRELLTFVPLSLVILFWLCKGIFWPRFCR